MEERDALDDTLHGFLVKVLSLLGFICCVKSKNGDMMYRGEHLFGTAVIVLKTHPSI